MLQLVVGVLKKPTVSISVEDGCPALLSIPEYVGCDIRSNKGQDRGGQSKLYPPSCSTIRGGLEGARSLGTRIFGSTASCEGTCKRLVTAWTQLVL